MAYKISSRGQVPAFIAMDVLRAANERAASGHDVLHLEVGQPSTPPPPRVIEAAKQALDREMIGYTDALGISSLRQALTRHYAAVYGLDLDPARIVVTTGSSGGFVLAFLSAFDPGDRVALASPGYPAYRNILTALDLEPILIPAEAEHGFQPTPDLLERVDGPIDGLILASPSNPTGTMVHRDELAELVAYCAAREIRLISDEIYHGITFEEPAASVLAFSDDAFVINSFSKYYSMTGWRLGWMVVPESLLRSVECLAQNFFISPPALSQFVGATALDCRAELDAYVADYARNRAHLLSELPKIGLERMAPADGAFYLYADVGHLTNDSEDFCQRMLADIGVATTPGVDFDPDRGARYLRISFAGNYDTMVAACQRLGDWLARD